MICGLGALVVGIIFFANSTSTQDQWRSLKRKVVLQASMLKHLRVNQTVELKHALADHKQLLIDKTYNLSSKLEELTNDLGHEISDSQTRMNTFDVKLQGDKQEIENNINRMVNELKQADEAIRNSLNDAAANLTADFTSLFQKLNRSRPIKGRRRKNPKNKNVTSATTVATTAQPLTSTSTVPPVNDTSELDCQTANGKIVFHNNSFYVFVDTFRQPILEKITQRRASEFCEAFHGSSLASVKTREENSFLQTHMVAPHSWIGGVRVPGRSHEWTWNGNLNETWRDDGANGWTNWNRY